MKYGSSDFSRLVEVKKFLGTDQFQELTYCWVLAYYSEQGYITFYRGGGGLIGCKLYKGLKLNIDDMELRLKTFLHRVIKS